MIAVSFSIRRLLPQYRKVGTFSTNLAKYKGTDIVLF